jgi:hypothetical protein
MTEAPRTVGPVPAMGVLGEIGVVGIGVAPAHTQLLFSTHDALRQNPSQHTHDETQSVLITHVELHPTGVGVGVAVEPGVPVGVLVGVLMGVFVGVFTGVFVGVLIGVLVGVAAGCVGVGLLSVVPGGWVIISASCAVVGVGDAA